MPRFDSKDDSNGGWEDTYTVRSGDTLSGIAALAGVTVEELAQMNGISDASAIVVGTQLRVPHEIETRAFEDRSGDNSGHGNGSDDQGNSGSGGHNDDHNDDNSGSGSSHDNSGSGSSHDNSGSGSHSDD